MSKRGVSIESRHKEYLKTFKERIIQLETEKSQYDNKLKDFDSTNCVFDATEKTDVENKIFSINQKLDTLKNIEMNYFLNKTKLLHSYYNYSCEKNDNSAIDSNDVLKTNQDEKNSNLKEKEKEKEISRLHNTNASTELSDSVRNNPVMISKLIQVQAPENSVEILNKNNINLSSIKYSKNKTKNTSELKKVIRHKKGEKIPSFFENMIRVVNVSNKGELLDEYFTDIDNTYQPNIIEEDDFQVCVKCGIEKTLKRADGEIACLKCGETSKCIVESEKKSYKDTPLNVAYFAYRRINHFNQILSQSQGKETVNITEEEFEKIKEEMVKKKMSKRKITFISIKLILRKLGYRKYYNNIPHIIRQFGGKVLNLSTDMEQKIRGRFMELQNPFKKCKNTVSSSRSSFLHYYYTLYQLLRLENYKTQEILPYIPMLKCKQKIRDMDVIWKEMMIELGGDENGWYFYKTVS
jgi:hypothetical protein